MISCSTKFGPIGVVSTDVYSILETGGQFVAPQAQTLLPEICVPGREKKAVQHKHDTYQVQDEGQLKGSSTHLRDANSNGRRAPNGHIRGLN